MRAPAETPLAPAVPLADTQGQADLRRRRRDARQAWTKHGRRVALSDSLSAGHEALAQVSHKRDMLQTPGAHPTTYRTQALSHAMARVRARQIQGHPGRTTAVGHLRALCCEWATLLRLSEAAPLGQSGRGVGGCGRTLPHARPAPAGPDGPYGHVWLWLGRDPAGSRPLPSATPSAPATRAPVVGRGGATGARDLARAMLRRAWHAWQSHDPTVRADALHCWRSDARAWWDDLLHLDGALLRYGAPRHAADPRAALPCPLVLV
jgi:hypothetical protein